MRRNDITMHNSRESTTTVPQLLCIRLCIMRHNLCLCAHRTRMAIPLVEFISVSPTEQSEYNRKSTEIGNDTQNVNSIHKQTTPNPMKCENNANARSKIPNVRRYTSKWKDFILTLFVTWLDKLKTCSRYSLNWRLRCRISFAWRSSAELYSDDPPDSNDAALPWAEIGWKRRKTI